MTIILIIVGSLLVCLFVGCSVVYTLLFDRVEEVPENQFIAAHLQWHDIDQTKYPREEVRFNSGRSSLQGFIYGGSNDKGLVVISHCMRGTADAYFPMIMFFVDRGWRVFAFNNTGVSGSEGIYMRGFPQAVIDLDAALHFVNESSALKELPIMLVGHSWGGYAVTAVLNYDHNVSAVVSFSGFNSGRELSIEHGISRAGFFFHLLSPHFWAIERLRFGRTMRLTAVDGINRADIPVMIVHASDDRFVSPTTTAIYAHRERITNPHAEFIMLDVDDGLGHEFPFISEESIEYIRIAEESLQRYWAETQNPSPEQWVKQFNFCKLKANELNSELMERINIFFRDNV